MSRKHEISCWQCNEMTSLETRNEFDGCCWACGVEIDLDDYLIKAMDKRDEHYAALSAVTAERDRHEANAYALSAETVAQGERIDQLRAEVEGMRKDALIGADAYRATVYVLRRAACDEVFGVAKLQRVFLLDWQRAERLLNEMARRGDVVQCAGHGWKFPDAAMAAKEA